MLVLVEMVVDRLTRVGDRLRRVVLDRILLVDLLGNSEQLRQADQLPDQGDDVVMGQDPGVEIDVEVEAGVELVAADPGQVVALGIEKELLEQVLGGSPGRCFLKSSIRAPSSVFVCSVSDSIVCLI
jgi:hypothetical protein